MACSANRCACANPRQLRVRITALPPAISWCQKTWNRFNVLLWFTMLRHPLGSNWSLLLVLGSLLVSGCLERELGTEGPRTTSLVSEQLRQAPPTKLDLLLVVDNSASMADKQVVMAAGIPDLIRTLAVPPCIDGSGARVARTDERTCPSGSTPEFEALTDIQVGVITTSLGGALDGEDADCVNEQSRDMAHLLPTRPRAQHIPSDGGVLAWKRGQDTEGFIDNLRSLVTLAGESGCGMESSLEAWYRFLIDPTPYTRLVMASCNDGQSSCVRRELDAEGNPAVDQDLLAQRAKFLRPDSLLVVVMLTDENDCSLTEHPYSWTVGMSQSMWRGSSACETDPNSECCLPCTSTRPPAACLDASGALPGCVAGQEFYSAETNDDPLNLRCYEQKRRFGIDFLQPTARYVNALRSRELCHRRNDNDPAGCTAEQLVENPLFTGTGPFARNDPDDVLLVGILGVPWQDIAVSPDATQRLVYLPSTSANGAPSINWSWLLTSENQDPLVRESVTPRQGVNPATGAALAPPESPRYANPINGHEHTNTYADQLQFACIFPLPEGERDCSQTESACDCTTASDAHGNPLCQAEDNSFGSIQYFAKAYPTTRGLEVLSGVGESAVVASICAKEMRDEQAPDYGYRPAMQAIVDKLKTKLTSLCFDRELTTNEEGVTNCKVIEITADAEACNCTGTRLPPSPTVRASVEKEMLRLEVCRDSTSCSALCACEIAQVPPGPNQTLNSCQTDGVSQDDGWCYVDGEWSEASAQLVSNCRGNARRQVRFVGDGVPKESSVTFLACQGSSYESE